MRYFALVLMVFIFGCATFKSQTHIRKEAKQTFVEFEDFGIRTKPILNREYIIFLCWYVAVYGEWYPEKVLEILPLTPEAANLTLSELENIVVRADTIFHLSSRRNIPFDIMPNSSPKVKKTYQYIDTVFSPILENYILNPKFIDYPLIGLSKHQILEMQKWMNDRYNEDLLVDAKYLNFNPEQKDEDCYVIEAAIIGQYEGSVDKYWYDIDYDNMNIYAIDRWQKHPYKPNFRLPYANELVEIEGKMEFDNNLREYSFGKNDFLWEWDKHYFGIYKPIGYPLAQMYFMNYFGEDFPYPFPVNSEFQLPKESMVNLILEENEQQFNNIAYLKDFDMDEDDDYYPEKDSIGRMSFVIVGADKENRPLVADRIQASNEPINNAIYRIVYNNNSPC